MNSFLKKNMYKTYYTFFSFYYLEIIIKNILCSEKERNIIKSKVFNDFLCLWYNIMIESWFLDSYQCTVILVHNR